MKSALLEKCRKKSNRKNWRPSGSGIQAAKIAETKKIAGCRGSRRTGGRKLAQRTETERVDAATSTSDIPTDTTQMFGDNNAIFGGNFTLAKNVFQNVKVDPFELLKQRVATSAFHNSAQRVDPPKCHPDTRVAILKKIHDWIIQSEQRTEWLLWLNGAAGAGKSAIMQSIAEGCVQATMSVASFFFLRSDPTRNTIAPFVATLAYQLIQVIPETMDGILLTIERNPLIFDQSLELQLQLLLIQPILCLPRNLQRLFVVFIDGLDECNDPVHQSNLIKVLGDISRGRNISVLFVVAGRREPQIEAAFKQEQVADLLHTVSLDEISASSDIRLFLNNKFNEIKTTHLRRHLLPTDWPSEPVIEELIDKSSGQFIFASVVINYISSPRASPAKQLEVVRGLRLQDPHSHNPFALLDTLYQHIFSQIQALSKVFDIIAYVLLCEEVDIIAIEEVFLLESGEIEILFSDLTAIIECTLRPGSSNNFKFLHASLPDFLLDKSRSEEYHIDLDKYRAKLLCMLLKRPPSPLDMVQSTQNLEVISDREWTRLYAIQLLLEKATVSEHLRSAIMDFHYISYTIILLRGSHSLYDRFLNYLRQLDFQDEDEAYRHVLDVFAAQYAKYWPSLEGSTKAFVKKHSPDLVTCISQILQVQ